MATFTVRLSPEDWDTIAEAVAPLVEAFPQFAYASVISEAIGRAPSTTYKQMEARGIILGQSTKQDRKSLSNVATALFFSPEPGSVKIAAFDLFNSVVESAKVDLPGMGVDPLA